MTPEQVAAIKARVAAATPEPWIYSPQRNQDNSYEDCPIHRPNPRLTCSGKIDPILYGGDGIVGSTESLYVTDADAEFIAHAREDIPALVTKIERLQAALERLMRYVTEYESDGRNGWSEAAIDEGDAALDQAYAALNDT